MFKCMNKFILSFLVSIFMAAAALAAPLTYALDTEASRVGFTVSFGPDVINGEMPVQSSEIMLDFDRPSQSRVSVVLDVTGARANFPFATQALRGPKVLNADAFGTISYASTGIEPIPGAVSKALMSGAITIRGVTRPLTLDVELFRPAGRPEGERERLIVKMSGEISRAAFGATGWSDLVGDTVGLDMMLQIDLVE